MYIFFWSVYKKIETGGQNKLIKLVWSVSCRDLWPFVTLIDLDTNFFETIR